MVKADIYAEETLQLEREKEEIQKQLKLAKDQEEANRLEKQKVAKELEV